MAAVGGQGPVAENRISGGVFLGTVIQGRTVNVYPPQVISPALSGLPPVSAVFTGRDREIGELLRVLEPGAAQTAPASLVTGLGGIGKTELVVQTARRALQKQGWFPGGVLFVDMFGYDPERRLPPEQALDGLLRALGVSHEQIPPGLQDRSRLFRSALAALAGAGSRILVVLDNVSSADHARPLLPADGLTAAILTSRDTLDLGARLFDLDGVDETSAIDMLDRAVREARGPGDTRVPDSPDAAAAIARSCGCLPLALRIAAALLADCPARPLSSLAQALQAQHLRLNRLRRQERCVRSAFDLSYERLDPLHARLFRLLSLNAGPDISTGAAARLVAIDRHETEELLQDLARTHLIEPGRSWGRWRLHDLVRLYADEAGKVHADADDRENARTRLYDYYIFHAAAAIHTGWSMPISRAEVFAPPSVTDFRFSGRAEARGWLDGERPNLVAAVTASQAAGCDDRRRVILAWFGGLCLSSWWHFDDLVAVTETVLALSQLPEGSNGLVAKTLAALGRELEHHGTHEQHDLLACAFDAQVRALAIFREHRARRYEAWALINFSRLLHEDEQLHKAAGEALAQAAAFFHEAGDQHGVETAHYVRRCLRLSDQA
ncbi:ATP-binding protein [Streptomyces sp. NRRL S-1022]|uniref:ATP-binding protein n=1 Tax=Streptomyces sp. NRRL S-1022 TaxID=1463880 RepID=UPI00099DAA57|nr:ATP-binding protein [Streptomyces sp. NRRL S-1022]